VLLTLYCISHPGVMLATQSVSEDNVCLQDDDEGSAMKPDWFDMDTWVSYFVQPGHHASLLPPSLA